MENAFANSQSLLPPWSTPEAYGGAFADFHPAISTQQPHRPIAPTPIHPTAFFPTNESTSIPSIDSVASTSGPGSHVDSPSFSLSGQGSDMFTSTNHATLEDPIAVPQYGGIQRHASISGPCHGYHSWVSPAANDANARKAFPTRANTLSSINPLIAGSASRSPAVPVSSPPPTLPTQVPKDVAVPIAQAQQPVFGALAEVEPSLHKAQKISHPQRTLTEDQVPASAEAETHAPVDWHSTSIGEFDYDNFRLEPIEVQCQPRCGSNTNVLTPRRARPQEIQCSRFFPTSFFQTKYPFHSGFPSVGLSVSDGS